MKDKIFMFIIGALVGAIVATGAFYIYTSTTKTTDCSSEERFKGGEPPEMPSGENGERPELPGGKNGQPPEKPGESNTESNSN